MDEMLADLISEGTKEGLASARARGRTGGRKPKLSPRQADVARSMSMYDETRDDGNAATPSTTADDAFAISRKTIYRHLETDSARRQPDKSTRPHRAARPGETGATSLAVTPAAGKVSA